MNRTIKPVRAMEILDSRDNPTLRSFVTLDNGIQASASVPSRASTGKNGAVELRKGNKKRYGGKGVLKAVETEAILESAREYYKALFKKLREKASLHHLEPECKVRVGRPADPIIHASGEEDVDLIAWGHRGKNAVKRWLLGSIPRRVVSCAGCSVRIVH